MPQPRNILVIFNDDHAQWASGAYGNREVHTPNIDYLAKSGVKINNAFTPTPVCSPGRACFLTGRLSSQHGVHDYLASNHPEFDERDWIGKETLLPQILTQNGYQTALSGKWHLGQDDRPNPAFDYWFSISGDYPFEHYGKTRYCDNGEEKFISGYITRVITGHALDFLKNRDSQKPFFLYVGYTATHSPWAGHPERSVAEYQNCTFEDIPYHEEYPFGIQALESTTVDRKNQEEPLTQYYAAVSQLDEGVGQLLDELEAQGLREDTLFIYTSDHGLNCGHHGIWGKGNGTLPLNMVDESIRIPMILNQPGHFEGGININPFIDHTDLFQTILEYCSIPAPQDPQKNYPGRSFLPLLKDPRTEWKDVQFGEYGNVRMARSQDWKLVLRYPDGPHELFDLQNDPREMTNLFAVAEVQPVIQELRTKMEAFFEKYEDLINSGLRVRELPRCNLTEAWRI